MELSAFNAVAAELHAGDQLRVRFYSGQEWQGELTGPVILGSPAREGKVSLTVDGAVREVPASEISLIDLIQ